MIISSGLDADTVDQVIDRLRVEKPESAVSFYWFLRSDYGFRHSRKCGFVVAHILAGLWRVKQLQELIKEIVVEEGECLIISCSVWLVWVI